MVESESLTLSEEEKHLLENYDSRQFGFVRWFEPVTDSVSNINHGTLLRKGTEYLLGKLRKEGRSVDPVVFCKLGHYHILLEEFVKAMSAYQRYFGLQEQYFKDAPFLYGLGIVYYHFNAYQWAIKAFQQLLYVDPSFSRANEVHLRLGLMFKTLNNFDASLKHLQLALLDSSPCSLSKVEIQFHIAHLFEIQSKYDLAKDAYQAIIAAPGMPTHIQSVAWRQLGWMYHIHHQLGENTERIHEAVNCLQKSLELDPSSGSSWYFLGRCYAQLGKIHDAFTAYRHAIDKAEANADTWCSIGVLYHQQSQPMDALQAYVCAVQLDNQHVAAWTDLGVLYETGGHFADAMVCYTNAHRACGGPNKGLETRMKILQEKMISPLAGELNKSLPTIEEAWKLPIPAELTTRTVRLVQQARLNQQVVLQAQNQFMQSHAGQSESDTPNVKQELEPKALASAEYREQTLHHTGHGQQARLSPVPSGLPAPAQSEQLLRTGSDVSYKSNVMDSLDASTNPTRDLNLDHGDTSLFSDSVGGSEALPHASLPVDVSLATTYIHCDPLVSPSEHRQLGPLAASTTAVSWSRSSLSINSSHDLNPLNVRVDKASLSDQNLNQINSESELLEGSGSSLSLSSALAKASNEMRMAPVSPLSITVPTSANDLPSSSGSPGARRSSSQSSLALSLISPLEGVRDHLKMGGMGVAMSSSSALLLSPHLVSPVLAPSNSLSRPSGSSYKVPKISLLLDEKDVPRLPARPAPLPLEQLYPPTPSITVTSRREAMSPALRNFCIDKRNPVTVIKGMCKALKLDLSMFTTRRLVEQNPDHPVEIRHQRQQPPDENWDEEGKKKQWYCWSSKSKTTIAKYAQYQASTYQESLKPNQQPEKEAVPPAGDSDSSNSSLLKPKKKKFKMIKFGTNVDLSDTKKWKPQLAELTKLPGFCKVVCGSNMLCHVGHNILGMNTVQLYMKIPGCRTPGHQENNCLAALNINIGPGDCEWFSVDHSYWGVINELCEKHNLNFLSGSWWPILEELCDERVPVHRFIQKPGDLVFINTGNVHWVQSLGWCNNIAWNVGPLVANQFSMAVERYEWNKMQGYKSIVPMINLTWGLSRNIRIPESKLAEHIKVCLYRSLHYCEQTLDILRQAGIEVHWHGREKNEAAHYCSMCEVEVFNLLFVKEMNKKLMVHCQDCARKTSATLDGFLVLNQYTIEELRNVYSAFCANMVAQHTKGQHPQQQQKQPTQSSLESQKHDADPAEVVEDPAGMAYGGASPVCEQDIPQDHFDADSMQHLVEPKLEPASEYDVMDVDK